MHLKFQDWKNGWSGISIGIDPDEVDRFIELLKMIREDPNQHFHISSDYKATGGLEISKSLSEAQMKSTT